MAWTKAKNPKKLRANTVAIRDDMRIYLPARLVRDYYLDGNEWCDVYTDEGLIAIQPRKSEGQYRLSHDWGARVVSAVLPLRKLGAEPGHYATRRDAGLIVIDLNARRDDDA